MQTPSALHCGSPLFSPATSGSYSYVRSANPKEGVKRVMSRTNDSKQSEAATAIDEVLVAETAARQAVEACHKAAEQRLEAAREDARRITRRANRRVSRLHAHCDAIVDARIGQIRAAASEGAVRTELNAADRDMLAQAVDRLAARLTRPGDD